MRLGVEQRDKGPDVGTPWTLADVRAAEVVDDYDRRDRRKKGRQFSQKVGLEIDDDVPAERNNPLRQREEGVLRSMIDEALQEDEPDPAYPAGVEPGQFRIGDRRIDHRDAARRPVRPAMPSSVAALSVPWQLA